MDLNERLRRQLTGARELTEGYLADMSSPSEWTHQVHPKANHPLWIMGHLAQTDDFFLSLVAPDRAREMNGYGACFGMGSQPSGDAAKYPPVEEIQGYFCDRRTTLLEVLDSLDEEGLAESLPEGTPDFLSDRASVFEMAVWHEGMHSGQLSVARRSLGYEPLFQPAG